MSLLNPDFLSKHDPGPAAPTVDSFDNQLNVLQPNTTNTLSDDDIRRIARQLQLMNIRQQRGAAL